MINLTYLIGALKLFSKAIKEGWHITIYSDYDADGLTCTLGIKRFFSLIGYTNYSIVPYTKRTHSIDPNVASVLLRNKSGLCIICDTGSSELGTLQYLNSISSVIVMDHHRGDIQSDAITEDLVVVNPTLWGDDYKMSAACVVYELLMAWVKENKPIEERYYKKMLCFYPFLSIYADGAYGANDYCYNLYQDAQEAILPAEFHFAQQNYIPTKRYVLFSVAPPLNSAFRNNRLDLINKLFLSGELLTSYEKANLMDDLMVLRAEIRGHIDRICEVLEPTMVGEFGLVDLTGYLNQGISNEVLWNNKGLIANRIADKYKCACVAIVNVGDHYVVSCRDYYGRDILSLMQVFYDVNGHAPAFGGKMTAQEVLYLKNTLKSLSRKVGAPKPRVVKNLVSLKERDLENIALLNEFHHQNELTLVSVLKSTTKLEPTPASFSERFYQYHVPYGVDKKIYVKKEDFDDPNSPYVLVQLYKGKRLMGSMVREA